MVIVYHLETGDILATIDGAHRYPGKMPEGCNVLVLNDEIGGRAIRHKVDVVKGGLREKTTEEIETERRAIRQADEDQKRKRENVQKSRDRRMVELEQRIALLESQRRGGD